jgi:hypothetical protein
MYLEIRPQDVVVVLKLLASDCNPWSYSKLGAELAMSPSHVFASIARAEAARLLTVSNIPSSAGRKSPGVLPQPNRGNLKEFLVHGVKYAFPVERGGPTRGIPTAEAAPPLKQHFPQDFTLPPVWPYAADDKRSIRGIEFSPLYKNVATASRDPRLYELLVLIDAIREGRAREREIAIRELIARIHVEGDSNEAPSWCEEMAADDAKKMFERVTVVACDPMRYLSVMEPYVDFKFTFVNATVFALNSKSIEGETYFGGAPLAGGPKIIDAPLMLGHGDKKWVILRQFVSYEVAKKIQQTTGVVRFDFSKVRLSFGVTGHGAPTQFVWRGTDVTVKEAD